MLQVDLPGSDKAGLWGKFEQKRCYGTKDKETENLAGWEERGEEMKIKLNKGKIN